MFNIFKSNKPKENTDLKWLAADMHSHIIPGIDDGSPDVDTSLTLIHGLQELGFTHFFATPHIYSEIYPNDRQSITAAQNQLNQALKMDHRFNQLGQQGVHAAAEYMLDDHTAQLFDAAASADHNLMTLPGKHVLVEMSYQFERKDMLDQLFKLQLGGYKPILAHPERYVFYHKDYKNYKRIKERGAKFQINLLSLSGYYGEGIRKVAQTMVNEGIIDYIGTDLHHDKHLAALQTFVRNRDMRKLFQNCTILNQQLL